MERQGDLKDLCALVTGGSRGIGAAIAAAFRDAGAFTLTPTRSECDLADLEATRHYSAALDAKVDILVNCAGTNRLASLEALEPALLGEALRIHLEAPGQLIRALAPGMRARGWGRILSIGSIWGSIAKPRRAAYAAAKAGMESFTRVLALELAPDNVLINVLAPGFVDTDLTRANVPPEELALLEAAIPLRRLGRPAELAQVALFLCSPRNTYITGQTIVADGGYLCR